MPDIGIDDLRNLPRYKAGTPEQQRLVELDWLRDLNREGRALAGDNWNHQEMIRRAKAKNVAGLGEKPSFAKEVVKEFATIGKEIVRLPREALTPGGRGPSMLRSALGETIEFKARQASEDIRFDIKESRKSIDEALATEIKRVFDELVATGKAEEISGLTVENISREQALAESPRLPVSAPLKDQLIRQAERLAIQGETKKAATFVQAAARPTEVGRFGEEGGLIAEFGTLMRESGEDVLNQKNNLERAQEIAQLPITHPRRVIAGLEFTLPFMLGIIAGEAVGGPPGAVLVTQQLIESLNFQEFRQKVNADGKRIFSDEIASRNAQFTSFGQTPLAIIFPRILGKRLARGLTSEVPFLIQLAQDATIEGVTEALEEIITIFGGQDGVDNFGHAMEILKESRGRIGEAGFQGLTTAGIISASTAGIRQVADRLLSEKKITQEERVAIEGRLQESLAGKEFQLAEPEAPPVAPLEDVPLPVPEAVLEAEAEVILEEGRSVISKKPIPLPEDQIPVAEPADTPPPEAVPPVDEAMGQLLLDFQEAKAGAQTRGVEDVQQINDPEVLDQVKQAMAENPQDPTPTDPVKIADESNLPATRVDQEVLNQQILAVLERKRTPAQKRVIRDIEEVKEADAILKGSLPDSAGRSFVQEGRVGPFATSPPQTRAGARLIKAISKDIGRKRPRIGMRNIVEYVNNIFNTKMLVGNTQTTRKNPAHFESGPNIIRTRSGNWTLNFHEAGHALSGFIRDRNPDAFDSLSESLIALTQMEDSMASNQSIEEGAAEFLRRYIADYGSIPSPLIDSMEEFLDENHPDLLAAIRDAHRAMVVHRSRDVLGEWKVDQFEKLPPTQMKEAVSDGTYWFLQQMIGGSVVFDKIRRRVFKGLAGPEGRGQLSGLLTEIGRENRRRAELFEEELRDSPADMRSAYQNIIHIPTEVGRVLLGPVGGKGRRGLRVRATGEIPGVENPMKDPLVRKSLKEAGFEIDSIDNETRHGNWIYVSDESIDQIRDRIGPEVWDDFLAYGQHRAALSRWNKKRLKYPRFSDGLTPEILEKQLKNFEVLHPKWKKEFKKLNKYFDQLLLIPLLSGEMTAVEIIRIKGSFEDYWSLPRRTEDRTTRQSGAGINPDTGIRQAMGSEIPFRDMNEAIEIRTKMALQAYYTNRVMLSVIDFVKKIQKNKDIPIEIRGQISRLAIPLKLDTKKMATLKSDEQAAVVADFLNRQNWRELTGKDEGFSVEALEQRAPGLSVTPSSIAISFPGRPVWRAIKPDATHINAPFINGQRQYYQSLDNVFFDMLVGSRSPNATIKWIGDFAYGVVQPWKRVLTQNLVFAVSNFLSRDPGTAGLLGEGGRALIPGYFAVVGAINRIRGTNIDAISESELLSRSMDELTREGHRTVIDQFKGMLTEGIIPPSYEDMTILDKVAAAPGQMMATALKPIDILNFITAGRHLSVLSEKLPREGAYIETLRRGYSEERAQLSFDEVTGNFGQRTDSGNLQALIRASGFLNPTIQISWSTVERMTTPNPKERAAMFVVRLPTLAVWGAIAAAVNYLFLDDDDKEFMRERSDEDRLRYIGLAGKIRIPFDYGPSGAAMSYGYNAIEGWLLDDPVKGTERAKSVLVRVRDLIPGPWDIVNPQLKTAIELKTGYAFFYDDRIVSAWMEASYPYNPELQVYPNTPEIFREIGTKLNVSPLKVQYAIRSAFSRQFDDAARMYDFVKHDIPIEESADLPVIGRLFLREPRGFRSQSVRTLSELDREFKAVNKKIQALEAVREDLSASKKASLESLEKRLDELEPFHERMLDISDIWGEIKDERNNPKPDRERIRELERQMTKEAREYLSELELPE